MKHAVAYYRASTEQQTASIEQQRKAVKEWAISRNVELVNSYRENVSGVTSERPMFRQMMEDLATASGYEQVPMVLFYDVSRLGRFTDPDEATYWIQHMKRLGMEVVFVQEEYENNLGGRIQRMLSSEMASEYSRKLSALVTRGMKHNAEQGHWNGGPAPFGYDREYRPTHPTTCLHPITLKDGVRPPKGAKVFLVVNEREASLVKNIFMWRKKDGNTLEMIAELLNRNYTNAQQAGCPAAWSKQKVARILANESLYRGTLTWHSKGGKFGVEEEEVHVVEDGAPSIL